MKAHTEKRTHAYTHASVVCDTCSAITSAGIMKMSSVLMGMHANTHTQRHAHTHTHTKTHTHTRTYTRASVLNRVVR